MKLRTLWALIPSLLFCLRYLPFRQAIKIPILVYKPKFSKLRGKVIIDVPPRDVTFGMIRLGLFITNQYPDTGIRWYNVGTVVFKGKACVGSNSAITVLREGSYLEFGDNFGNASSLRVNCDYRIVFQGNVRIGWDVSVLDSSMHLLKDLDGNFVGKAYAEVVLGRNTWIAAKCTILQGTKLPDYSVVGACSLLNKDYTNYSPYSLFVGSPARYVKTGVWRDMEDDKIKIE